MEASAIDRQLVYKLISSQFPQWRDLTVMPVPVSGHDNRTFRLGEELCVRLPSAAIYEEHVALEYQWLPNLHPLPQPITQPVAKGRPGSGYPWSWLINTWLQGESANISPPVDLSVFALDLADFLCALEQLNADGGPLPGPHNFFRGSDLAAYDVQTRKCLAMPQTRARHTTQVLAELWRTALASKWETLPVWVHGDVAAGNLLVRDGRLAGVIDFGQLAAGDPACDLTIAWTLFVGDSRQLFMQRMQLDDATWQRARGWALWKALLQIQPQAHLTDVVVERAHQVIADLSFEV